MNAITIHPESIEQFEMVKDVLKALKVPFESQQNSLPEHVVASVTKGLEQIELGQSISLDTFKEKHFRQK